MDPSSKYKLLYEQQNFPIFQNCVYATKTEAINCTKGNIKLVEDLKTGLVYNKEFNPNLMDYDSNYQNEQAVSGAFQNHLEKVSEIIKKTLGQNSIIEIGCGKGYFLELLLKKNIDITGFDPAYEGSNPRILKQYYSPQTSQNGKGIILRHVLEHIQDPYNFLLQLKHANNNKGRIYIEVPCFDWICSNKAWFDIFYEHVNYFRLSDFHRMFGTIIESGHLFGGQYLFIVAELATLKSPTIDWTDRVNFPEDLITTISSRYNDPKAFTIWGGSSKGVIFSLFRERNGNPIKTVIDINKVKQNQFLPSTGLHVKSPESALSQLPKGSTIYIMNSNYLEEIKSMTNNQYNYIGLTNE